MLLGSMRYLVTVLLLIGSVYLYAQQEDTTGFIGFKTASPVPLKGATSVFKVGIIPFLEGQVYGTGEFRFNYERIIAPRQSILAGVSYDFPNLIGLAVRAAGIGGGRGGGGRHGGYGGYGRSGGGTGILGSNDNFEGVRGMLGYRYYFQKHKNGPTGLYAGPYLSYNFVDVRQRSATQNYEELNFFDACGVLGFQAIKKNHFTFDFTMGLGYRDNFVTHPNNNIDYSSPLNIKALDHVKFLLQLNFGYSL